MHCISCLLIITSYITFLLKYKQAYLAQVANDNIPSQMLTTEPSQIVLKIYEVAGPSMSLTFMQP